MEFNWLPLNWDAVATLLTGFAAVGGAVFVGRRQLEITKIQTAIQERQGEDDRQLRQQNIKLELLEKRIDCVVRLREIENQYFQKVAFDRTDLTELFQILESAHLIFPAEVTQNLLEVIKAARRKEAALKSHDSLRNRGDQEKADEKLEKVFEFEDQVFQLLPATVEKMIEVGRITDWD